MSQEALEKCVFCMCMHQHLGPVLQSGWTAPPRGSEQARPDIRHQHRYHGAITQGSQGHRLLRDLRQGW